jgi:hypothetical protein
MKSLCCNVSLWWSTEHCSAPMMHRGSRGMRRCLLYYLVFIRISLPNLLGFHPSLLLCYTLALGRSKKETVIYSLCR